MTLVYGGIGITRPVDVFWSPNQGSKLLQVQALVDGRWDLAVDYAGQAMDPAMQFRPYVYSYLRNDGIQVPWSVAWALPSAWSYGALGPSGLILLSLLGGLAGAWSAGRLAERLLPGSGRTAMLLAGLATPLLVYSTLFWEHAPAAGAYALGLHLLLRSKYDLAPKGLLAAGIAFGLAVAWRNETVIFLLAALAVVFERRSLRLAGRVWSWLVAGLLLVLAPLGFYNWQVLGGLTAQRMVPLIEAPAGVAANLGRYLLSLPPDLLVGRPEGEQWLPELSRWAPVAGVVLLAAAPHWPRASRRWLVPTALVLVGSATATMLLILPPPIASGFLLAAPFLAVVVLKWGQLQRLPHGRSLLFVAFAGLLLYTVAAMLFHVNGVGGSGSQWGPRFLLPLYPLAAALAAVAIRLLESASHRVELVLARGLVLAAVLFQLLGLVQIEWQLEQTWAHGSTLARLPGPLVMRPGFLVEFAPGWLASRPVFCVQSPAAFGRWTELALQADEREFWFVDQRGIPSSWLVEDLAALESISSEAGISVAQRYDAAAVRRLLRTDGSITDSCAQPLRN